MANATTNIQGKYRPSGGAHRIMQQAAEDIPYGAMVMVNAAGFVANATDTASTFFLGIAIEESDNSGGSAGDLSILVDIGGAEVRVTHATGSLAIANVGDQVNCEFNNEVDDGTSTNDILAGVIIEVIAATDIWIKCQAYSGNI